MTTTTLVVVLSIVLFVALLILSLQGFLGKRGTEIDENEFVRQLQQIAGPGARKCGLVWLTKDSSTEIQCRDNAMKYRQPFYYAFKQRYHRWWLGLAQDHSGKTWQVIFDREFEDSGVIHISSCPQPRFSGAMFTCEWPAE